MRGRNVTFGRLWLAALAAIGLTGLTRAALTEAQQESLSYYSTFDDTTKGIAPELGTGTWNTGDGGNPAFITVSGSDRALNLASYNAWTNGSGSGQSVLSAEDEAFTIAFSARGGSTAKGILFAFGTNSAGGLSFRRGATAGSLVACTGKNVERIAYVPEGGADVTYRHYALVKDASGLWLYVDGALVNGTAATVDGQVIAPMFQWGSRHGNNLSGEARGNGAIATLGVWKRALSAEEIGALVTEMSPSFSPVSFDVPEGWTAKPVPTQTVQRSLTGNLALEQDTAFRQTLGGRGANVAEITGGDNRTIFGVNDSGHGNKDTALERDVWLKVSGGTHALVVGGSENHWQGNHATPLRGDVAVELGASATVNNLVGAVYKGGYVGTGAANGNVLLTVKGKVNGAVVGGTLSAHNVTPVITGNTRVRVLAVQPTNQNAADGVGYRFVGGSAYMANSASGARQTGNASVEVVLPEAASGGFVKEIVGGSYARNGSYAITGNTSVSISAPNAVTFTKPIYGASVSDSSTATVSGDSSVTLDGGTYSGNVFAGGYGANGGVAGKATLTLKGGAFSGILGVGASGATAGSSELVIDGGEEGIDLSAATASKDFQALTLKSGLNLGANRLPNAALAVVGEQTLTIAVTAAEVADRRVTLGLAESVPEGLTVEATGLPEGEEWSLTVEIGELRYTPAKRAHTWATPTEGSAWADGLPDFKAGDDVAFGVNAAQEPVTLGGDVRMGDLAIAGDYAFGGTGLLSADTAAVPGTLTLGKPAFRYLRLTPSGANGTGSNVYPGIAELVLYKGGAPVAWPRGTTIRQVNANGSEVAPDWTAAGNEKPNALIDGVYGGTSGTYVNPYDGSTGTYSGSVNNNKWWPTGAEGAGAVITLGSPVVADGYMIWHTDHAPRSPNACKLEASADGLEWVTLDDRTFFPQDARPSAPNTAYAEAPFPMSAHTVDGGVVMAVADGMTVSGTLAGAGILVGDVAFAEGSALAVPAEGTLLLEGAVSGTATLDVSAWGALTDATVRAALRAPKGLTLVPPEGYAVHHADGCYWLARALTQPFAATLSGDVVWEKAAWVDATGLPVAEAQWDVLPEGEVSVEITLGGDATLSLEGARTVTSLASKGADRTLTLAGARLTAGTLTLEGALTATVSGLSYGSATLADGATLTMAQDVASTLPRISGGTYVKTGEGALTIVPTAEPSGTALRVVSGGVRFCGATGSQSAKLSYEAAYDITVGQGAWMDVGGSATTHHTRLANTANVFTLEGGASLRFGNGAFNGADYGKVAGAIYLRNATAENPVLLEGATGGNYSKPTGSIAPAEGEGAAYLRLDRRWGNPWTVPARMTGNIHLIANATNVTVSGDNDYVGGTEVRDNLTVASAEALGIGDVTVNEGKTLTVTDGTALNLHRRVGGAGTVSGAANLLPGASLDASAATAEARLTVGTLTVAEGAAIPVTLPEGVTSGTMLLAWGAAPASADFVAAEETPLAPTAALVSRDDGLYYEEMAFGTAGSDGAAVATLSEDAQRRLAAVAFAAGAASVTTVTGATASRPLTAAEIDAALTCFRLTPAVSVGEGGAATVTVAYDFGIAAMAYDPATEGLTVTARVQGVEGAAATFAEGVRVELYAADDPTAALAVGEAAAGAAEVPLTVAPATARAKMARPLKVRAVAP